MTKTYKLRAGSFDTKRKSIIKRGILLSIVAISGGLTLSAISTGLEPKALLIAVPIIGIAIFSGLKRSLRLQKEAWESYEIKWDMHTIIKSEIRIKDISIQKNDISEISKYSGGVVLKSINNSTPIYIPAELENFSELINEIKHK